jgi:hypothetical protein
VEFAPLAICRSSSRPDVAERVPALDQDHPMFGGTREPDIHRSPGFVRARRELEGPGVARPSTDSEHQFLDREVTGVRWSLEEVPPKRDQERAIHRDGDPLKDVDVEVRGAPLDPALDHAADPGPASQLGARPPATFAHRSDLTADPDPLFIVSPPRLDRELGASDTGHDRYMFIPRASPPLISRKASIGRLRGVLWAAARSLVEHQARHGGRIGSADGRGARRNPANEHGACAARMMGGQWRRTGDDWRRPAAPRGGPGQAVSPRSASQSW